ncbi:MAG: 50S ribosomal protein L24 [Candidatus Zixiibacteriota bacterium]
MATKYKIKKGDLVKVLTGEYRGRTGKVLKMFPKTGKAIVQGVNLAKMHRRATQTNPQGGIEEKEAPLDVSNLMLICPKCNLGTRVAYVDVEGGGLVRVCKKCKEMIDA